MNMEVFEAADKVAAAAIAEATAMALLIGAVAGGAERKGAADADLLYTKLPEGRALGSGKWDGEAGSGNRAAPATALNEAFAVTNADSGLDPQDRVLRDLREESASEHLSI
uniref:GG10158 n=1 Tax=Drosophila erecta TaxID=7220 RepID=B3P2R3_DROER